MDKRSNSVSVCMIARDEEGIIGDALRSVKDLADEMIVVDTGSTDGTALEARQCGAKVFEMPWRGDFSEARNFALSKATREWILVLDADEAIEIADHERIRGLVRDSGEASYFFTQRTYTNDSRGPGARPVERPDEITGRCASSFSDSQIRLFPNDRAIRYACEIHENVEASLLAGGIPARESGIVIHHYGRIRETGRVCRKALVWCALDREGMPAFPAHPRFLYELAAQFLDLGRARDALSHARAGLELEPRSPELWNIAGLAHLRNGDTDEALSYLRKGLALEPGSAELHNNAGVVFMERNEPAEALLHFERGIELEGDNPDILRNAASACALVGELGRGLEYVDRSLALDPFASHAHAIRADVLARMGDVIGAAAVLEGMRFLSDTPLKVYLKVIQLYTRMRMIEHAEKIVERAIGEFPERTDLWYLAGKLSELRGDDERAAALYHRVLPSDQCFADSLASLGCVHERAGRLEEALGAFREALRRKPGDTELETNAGIVLDKLERPEEAELHFARALERGGRSAFVCNALGCHLARSKRYDEAVVYFTRAVEIESGNASYYQNLGLACEKMNLFDRAAQAYERMAALDPRAASVARECLIRIGESPVRTP